MKRAIPIISAEASHPDRFPIDRLYSLSAMRWLNVVFICLATALLSPTASAGLLPDFTPIVLPQSPALATNQSRASDPATGWATIGDFDRVIFVPPGVPITRIGKNNGKQLRAFASATAFYKPSVTVENIVRFAGGIDNPSQELAVLRCRPPDLTKVEPTLATWPNVFKDVVTDLGTKYTPAACPADLTGLPIDNQVYCLAQRFTDQSSPIAAFSLAAAMDTGAAIFNVNYPPPSGEQSGGDVLYDLYGIGSGFSGLGFTVRDSANVSMTSTQALQQSVVPEYLLDNVTLAEGGCSFIRVLPYKGNNNIVDKMIA